MLILGTSMNIITVLAINTDLSLIRMQFLDLYMVIFLYYPSKLATSGYQYGPAAVLTAKRYEYHSYKGQTLDDRCKRRDESQMRVCVCSFLILFAKQI